MCRRGGGDKCECAGGGGIYVSVPAGVGGGFGGDVCVSVRTGVCVIYVSVPAGGYRHPCVTPTHTHTHTLMLWWEESKNVFKEWGSEPLGPSRSDP